jgi:hypothetical protein
VRPGAAAGESNGTEGRDHSQSGGRPATANARRRAPTRGGRCADGTRHPRAAPLPPGSAAEPRRIPAGFSPPCPARDRHRRRVHRDLLRARVQGRDPRRLQPHQPPPHHGGLRAARLHGDGAPVRRPRALRQPRAQARLPPDPHRPLPGHRDRADLRPRVRQRVLQLLHLLRLAGVHDALYRRRPDRLRGPHLQRPALGRVPAPHRPGRKRPPGRARRASAPSTTSLHASPSIRWTRSSSPTPTSPRSGRSS